MRDFALLRWGVTGFHSFHSRPVPVWGPPGHQEAGLQPQTALGHFTIVFWTEWPAPCKGLDGIHEQVRAPATSGSCPLWGHQLRTQASSSLMQNCSCRASTSLLKVAQGWLPPWYKSPSNHSPNWPLKRRGKSWYGSLLGVETFQTHTMTAYISKSLKPIYSELLETPHIIPHRF